MRMSSRTFQAGLNWAIWLTESESARFPSYTETFGQVILEAMASGLPVVGLDAEGTKDLVIHGRTGYLLRKPASHSSLSWSQILSSRDSALFQECTAEYAKLLRDIVCDRKSQSAMRKRARTEGVAGRTWFDAMEAMVDCYREGIDLAEEKSGSKRTPTRRRRMTLEGCPAAIPIRLLTGCLIMWSLWHMVF